MIGIGGSFVEMLKRLFTDHPSSVDETYGQHFSAATRYGARMLGAGIACLVHAVFPFLCVRTGSAAIDRLHRHMTDRSGPLSAPQASAPPARAETAAAPMADPSARRG